NTVGEVVCAVSTGYSTSLLHDNTAFTVATLSFAVVSPVDGIGTFEVPQYSTGEALFGRRPADSDWVLRSDGVSHFLETRFLPLVRHRFFFLTLMFKCGLVGMLGWCAPCRAFDAHCRIAGLATNSSLPISYPVSGHTVAHFLPVQFNNGSPGKRRRDI